MSLIKKGKDDIYAYVLVLLVYVPSNTWGNIVRVFAAALLFVLKSGFLAEFKIRRLALFMVVSPVFPALIVMLLEHGVNMSLVAHEVMRMIFCAFIIMTVSRFQVSFRCLYICCVAALIPNFIIQVLQYNDVESAFTFVKNNYVDSSSMDEWTHLELARIEGGGFRSGAVFINPNVYMVIPLLSAVVFFKQDSKSPNIMNYLLIGCAMASCLLTGSRTATVVLAVILGIYLFRYSSGVSKAVFAIGFAAVLFFFGSSYLSGSRAFSFSGDDSLAVKFRGYYYFWKSTLEYPLYWITGSLGSRVAAGVDSEFGHIYSWFGLFGLYWYVNYLRIIYRRNTGIPFYSKPVTYVSMLVAFSASVLLCMPIYSFVCLIQFSNLQISSEE